MTRWSEENVEVPTCTVDRILQILMLYLLMIPSTLHPALCRCDAVSYHL